MIDSHDISVMVLVFLVSFRYSVAFGSLRVRPVVGAQLLPWISADDFTFCSRSCKEAD